ncbi:PglZ domain-containing protein [Bradyrhizobium sp. 62]|uniref:PglZ domain-containing protein n=1 Tax=Bradyrhizobium sp. 62 TaxID=1043588 RepID=UPI001FF80927|nr:PglZ domain-containing protein [Bradyrhizobium sp. 62]MCK1365187.1 PglZ domain-containing protein [Bradyrhizobium sp. 62]
MHPLHQYIAGQISDRVKERRVVVMYDKRGELRPFFAELVNTPEIGGGPVAVNCGPRKVFLYVFDGSFLKARLAVEDLTSEDQPNDVVIYIPGLDRDAKGSLLMELEKAGTVYQHPALKMLARLVLRKRFTDVALDEMLKSDSLTYADFARMTKDETGTEGASLLKSIFGGSDTLAILTTWIGDTDKDGELDKKGALGELRAAALARLGLTLPADGTIDRMRSISARYVLANEFRLDLGDQGRNGPAATLLKNVPEPGTADQQKAAREVAKRLRERHPKAFEVLADGIQSELGLSADTVDGRQLGAIDTFRFEEAAVVATCFDLIAEEKFAEASGLMASREESFWVNLDVGRKTVWAVCRLMVDLGLVAASACETIAKSNGNPSLWVERYVSTGGHGWYLLDHAQRRLEGFLATVEDPIEERAVAKIRAVYENAVRRMTDGFVKAFQKSDWTVPGVLQQTRIWSDVVASRPVPVAYLLVDAMRYEMGQELVGRLALATEVVIRPAIAALPSITPVGMAALLPGAAGTFSVVTSKGKFGASVDGEFLPDLAARQKFIKSRVPRLVDLELDEVLSSNPKALQKKIGEAKIVVVRSSEIDGAGENTSTFYARRIMDRVVEDLARCLQRLAAVGIGEAVITADHGHLFFAEDRDPSMRIDAPGGETVDLHRRCWIGRGGSTPPGSVRVSGPKLGYNSDVEFAFPTSTAVFKSGGDLAYHHGGPSIQELVIPVITAKLSGAGAAKPEKNAVTVAHDFDAVTNRIFTVRIELGGASKNLFENARKLRPLVLSGDKPVARAAIATGAALEDGSLTLGPGVQANVAFMLTDDQVKTVRIQVLDAETDAVLYLSPKDIPVRLGV